VMMPVGSLLLVYPLMEVYWSSLRSDETLRRPPLVQESLSYSHPYCFDWLYI
jgi:hypothetical protein